jgi:signal transduction histidine kinase
MLGGMAPRTTGATRAGAGRETTLAEGSNELAAAPVASPLLHAALGLVAPSATAADVEARFSTAGARLEPGVATSILERLAALGLVRVIRGDGHRRRFTVTSLGQRVLDASTASGESDGLLGELERLRSDLLSTIAHELRTPLTAVRTSVGLLLDPALEPTDEQRRALLSSIERTADRMQRLTHDILELARFRAGGVALQLRRFPAVGLAEAAVALVTPLAARDGQRLELDRAVSAEHAVYGDRRRLEQALVNLVANAQRFTPAGGAVGIRIEARGDRTAWVVRDEGPGIPDEDQPRLFERFFVGRGGRAAPQDGVGLGLPTALAIAQAHGGTIEVTSTVGDGSTFALVVPTGGPEDEP